MSDTENQEDTTIETPDESPGLKNKPTTGDSASILGAPNNVSVGSPTKKNNLVAKLKQLTPSMPLAMAASLVLLSVALIVFVTIQNSKEGFFFEDTELSAEELAKIDAVSTGNSATGKILTVDAQSVFEKKVVIKDSLEIVGGLTVGGPINIPDLQIGTGSLSLETASVSGDFQVQGSAVFGGTISSSGLVVSGDASIGGDLVAQSLSLSNFNLLGNITLSKHIRTNGQAVSGGAGAAIGSGGTMSVNGNDITGTININTGSSTGSGVLATINFVDSYSSIPQVLLTPASSAAAKTEYYINRTTTGFTILAASPASDGATLQFDYFVIE